MLNSQELNIHDIKGTSTLLDAFFAANDLNGNKFDITLVDRSVAQTTRINTSVFIFCLQRLVFVSHAGRALTLYSGGDAQDFYLLINIR